MIVTRERQSQALTMLHDAIATAVAFFGQVNPGLVNGQETAHTTLVTIAFWLCEHITVAEALVDGSEPALKNGTLADLNRTACQLLGEEPPEVLVRQLPAQGARLDSLLQRLPDWHDDFPIKQGGRASTVEDRVIGLAVSIHSQIAVLRRAALLAQVRAEAS